MKTLKNKIFAGSLTLASLGFFGEKNVSAQSADTLDEIFINHLTQQIYTEQSKTIFSSGYKYDSTKTKNRVFFVKCYDKNGNGDYEQRLISKNNQTINEQFDIYFDTGLIDYRLSLNEESLEIVNLKNLTKEQIYQDKKFAERTKRIINACESDEKLREIIKEVYGDSYDDRGHKILINVPKITQ